jgi:death-on-curing protein
LIKPPKDPEFLGLEEILEIHQDQVRRFGGSSGIRDLGLLQSAIAMPMAQFGGQYLHRDLFEMAAAYLFHVVQNHPFIDANKRTGAAAADVFLTLNGVDLQADEREFETMVLSIAEGKTDKVLLAGFLRQHSHATRG